MRYKLYIRQEESVCSLVYQWHYIQRYIFIDLDAPTTSCFSHHPHPAFLVLHQRKIRAALRAIRIAIEH